MVSIEVDGPTTLVLISTVFVLCMTIPGLALFYGSLVSRRNLIDTMLQSVMLTLTLPLVWWMVAYSLCFDDAGGPVHSFLGGLKNSGLRWGTDSLYSGVPESAWCVFQLTFAIITTAIACGAVAERALLWPVVLFSNIWLVVVYCPICHMVWGNGILQQWGVLDTAGGLVVETCSGFTALVLCYFVGPRRLPAEDADPVRAVLHIIGAAILWVGWLAFNGGSAYTSGARASTTILNTMLAGSAGGFGWLSVALSSGRGKGMPHLMTTFHVMGGSIAGLCAATPSSGFVTPTASVIIGFGAGVLCFFANEHLLPRLLQPRGIDDVVSVFPVHGIAGVWGTLMTGVFADESVGGTRGGIQQNWRQVQVQLAAILIVSVWTIVGTAAIVFFISRCLQFRATATEELAGLDTREHGKAFKEVNMDQLAGKPSQNAGLDSHSETISGSQTLESVDTWSLATTSVADLEIV